MQISGKFKHPGIGLIRRPFLITGEGSMEARPDGLFVKGEKPPTVHFSFLAAFSALAIAAGATWLLSGSVEISRVIVSTLGAGFGVGMAISGRDGSLETLIPWSSVRHITARGQLLQINVKRFRPSGMIRFSPNGDTDIVRCAETLRDIQHASERFGHTTC